ncbi:MAG: thioredoxin domain-containing protein [Bacteroidia bacterium]|nr:thioredoxin domain-containing protein [Bacteroidia bacterium]
MKSLFIGITLAFAIASCTSSKNETVKDHKFTNDLIHETSPYLLQHAHNPVNWKPWNAKTLQEAKDQKKLMIVSIGYAACHWCHVMERESFEDSTVAAVMNDKFISVKVDREERPDVDQVYISAVQLMTGRAGWPLNVITLPDGRPVWGGTYFQKEDWIQAIDQISTLYEEEPQKLVDYATRLEQGIKSLDLIELNTDEIDYTKFEIQPVIDSLKRNLDVINGGTRGAPKFMMPRNVAYWMRTAQEENDEQLMEHVLLTLDKMAFGGVYDQIGGGFARYSTDSKWHVPHFEKMLYDNGQLASLYSEAFAITGKTLYKEVVEETLEFVSRELTHDAGAFYSSLDADSKTETGALEEGTYYIYTEEELRSVIKDDFALFQDYYNVNDFGKWEEEGKYVLIRTKSDAEIIKAHALSQEVLQKKKQAWKRALMEFRNKRPKPRLDDKTLTSWNGLMLKGYVDAYKVFGTEAYLKIALKNARFIAENQLLGDGRLWHNYKNGKSNINGYLEDYASVIDAYIGLYEVTLNEEWLDKAKSMADYTLEHFHDTEKGMFYFTSDEDAEIVTRTIDYRDNVIPSSNSMMAKNLFVLSHHFDERNFADIAHQMLKNVQGELEQYPGGFSNWLDLLSNYRSPYYELVVVGPEADEMITKFNKIYLPGKLIAGSTSPGESPLLKGRFLPGKTYIYVCVNNTCKLPVTETEKALELMK